MLRCCACCTRTRGGQEPLPGVGEMLPRVAARRGLAEADDAGADPVRAQQLRQPARTAARRLPVQVEPPLAPRGLLELAELADQLCGGELLRLRGVRGVLRVPEDRLEDRAD